MSKITTIILTYNEEKNITKCIKSIKAISTRILVVDSFSKDNTVVLAKKLGAEVYQNRWINYASQFNYAVENLNIDTEWILRLDADEEISASAAIEIESLIQNKTIFNGVIIPFKVNFLGKDLRWGGTYPFTKLLLFKKIYGKIQNKNMDEHIVLSEGKIYKLKSDSIHKDFKTLSDWIDKHNKYSSREVKDYNSLNSINKENSKVIFEKKAKTKSIIKNSIYYKFPLFFRSYLYFVFRYYFLLGFLDGARGLIYCFLQAYWYRFLVDAKIFESKIKINENTPS
jgi:glycosyltransferase involved in cell wall biosynthesis